MKRYHGVTIHAIPFKLTPLTASQNTPGPSLRHANLITFMGGPATTESRLDTMFIPGLKTTAVGTAGTNGIGTTLFNPGNEPSFATPSSTTTFRGDSTRASSDHARRSIPTTALTLRSP
jgi:hypothetical protein